MGNDGGTIARRDDLVRTKAAPRVLDPRAQLHALWTLCALSRQPLREPVVSDALGRLYNKDAVVEYLLQRSDKGRFGEGEAIAGHLRGLKDVRPLRLTQNPTYRPPSPTSASSDVQSSPYVCPLTQKEMNGKHRFVYLRTCGCVLSEAGLRAVSADIGQSSSKSNASEQNEEPNRVIAEDVRTCPQCAVPYHANALMKGREPDPGGDVVVINPPATEQAAMRSAMEAARAEESSRKSKAKAAAGAEGEGDEAHAEAKKKRKAEKKAAREATAAALAAELGADGAQPNAKRARVADAPSMSATAPGAAAARKVGSAQAALAAKLGTEQKPLSPAIASIYGHGREKPKGETWMTRGTFTRYA